MRTASPEDVPDLRAELEWVRGQDAAAPPVGDPGAESVRPCYFNSGCCSFGDGDITGLEIADGRIRLVRWPDGSGAPRPESLVEADLKADIYARL